MKLNQLTSYFLILSILSLCACKTDNTGSALPHNLSKTENEGLQEIIKIYSGVVHFDKGAFPATADTEPVRIFEVTLSESSKVEEQLENAKLISSNLAWLMYKHMDNDANNYDEIHAVLITKDNKTTIKYPVDDLKVVAKKMKLIEKLVALIKDENYEAIRSMLNNKDLIEYPKDEILAELNFRSKTNGAVKGFTPAGFKRNKSADGKSILQLSGFLNREKLDHPISIAADMQSDKEEVLFLQFML